MSGYRYANIRYAQHNEPIKAAIGCYLWNLYDGYSGGSFEMPAYDVGDNDDISGLSYNVFERIRTLDLGSRISGVSAYHDFFKSGVPSDVRPSIDDAYAFMFDDLVNIPSHKMRPAQVKDIALTTLSQTDIRFSWTPQIYPSYYTEVNPPTQVSNLQESRWKLESNSNRYVWFYKCCCHHC